METTSKQSITRRVLLTAGHSLAAAGFLLALAPATWDESTR